MKEITTYIEEETERLELTKEKQEKAAMLFPYGVWKQGGTLFIKPKAKDKEIKLKSPEEVEEFIKAVRLTALL